MFNLGTKIVMILARSVRNNLAFGSYCNPKQLLKEQNIETVLKKRMTSIAFPLNQGVNLRPGNPGTSLDFGVQAAKILRAHDLKITLKTCINR